MEDCRMENVLLITNIYPMNDKSYGGTPVCHFFSREWKAMGYNVKVVHFESLFPRLYYVVGKLFNKYIQAKTGCVAYTNTPRKSQGYFVEDISVLLVPILKFIPHTNFSLKRVEQALSIVYGELVKDNFVPDIITGHFLLPQLEMLYYMKQKFPDAKTCMVLHSDGAHLSRIYKHYREYMQNVDVWGFRSEAFRHKFEELYGRLNRTFICYSGIPEKYVEIVRRDFSQGVKKFVFVGSLYKLKRVEDTIMALNKVFPEKGFTFDIVGDGAERENLHSLVRHLHLEKQVTFHGQLSRDEAQKVICQADCFVMVSSREAFGLVYVEAMAKGCLTIATKGQGIDGVIVNGENGFLCEAENVNQLALLITRIISLSPKELKRISCNAIMTAQNMTDRKVAEHYINSIKNKNCML